MSSIHDIFSSLWKCLNFWWLSFRNISYYSIWLWFNLYLLVYIFFQNSRARSIILIAGTRTRSLLLGVKLLYYKVRVCTQWARKRKIGQFDDFWYFGRKIVHKREHIKICVQFTFTRRYTKLTWLKHKSPYHSAPKWLFYPQNTL